MNSKNDDLRDKKTEMPEDKVVDKDKAKISFDNPSVDKKTDNNDEQIAQLNEKIALLEKELAEQKDKTLRALAELDNYRKRTYKEIQDARFFAKIDVVIPFLKVFDHFNLAVKAADEKHSFEVLHQGMEMILAEFSRALDELGIERINASGQFFNPQLHEAAEYRNSDSIPEGQIVEQWRCGYKMGNRIIQPALVVVSAGAKKESIQDTAEQSNFQEDLPQKEDNKE